MNRLVKYNLLKELVTWMGLYEWMALGLGSYFIGAKAFTASLAFFISMGISYYLSTKLGYKVLEMLVELNGTKSNTVEA